MKISNGKSNLVFKVVYFKLAIAFATADCKLRRFHTHAFSRVQLGRKIFFLCLSWLLSNFTFQFIIGFVFSNKGLMYNLTFYFF